MKDHELDFDDDFSLDEWDSLDDAQDEETISSPASLSRMPMFQALFSDAVAGDPVLEDFATYVVGELSDHFALKAAKGGAFFQNRKAEGMTEKQILRFQNDQSLRAHLMNGMLPALRIARQLKRWGAPYLEDWDERNERIFIAGYMLHDYSKIEAVQDTLRQAGFYDGEAPSERQIPVLENVFRDWCNKLGLAQFLEPIGGIEHYLQDLIYIACNTQRLKGTARAPFLFNRRTLDVDARDTITELSRLADLVTYVAPTPRDLVGNEGIKKLITQELAYNYDRHKPVARLVYHHVAENRGLLLNFINNAVIEALTIDDVRVPLLYAPSGVVYLERHDAPSLPDVDSLVTKIVDHVRTVAGNTLIRTGKGAKRGNTFLQIDDSYNDFFSVPELILNSMQLIVRYIRNNKTPDRFRAMQENQWIGWNNIPDNTPSDPQDARADQIAEWAGFVETQFRDRINKNTEQVVDWLLDEFRITDLKDDFIMLKTTATKGGLRYWWHWAAAHALSRKPGMDEVAVQEWLQGLSEKIVDLLPTELPPKAQANQGTWQDLENYVQQVLTVSGIKAEAILTRNELSNYVQAKSGRGGGACAICGSDYSTRKPAETAVSFQPGVYTQRLRIGASDNKRQMCSICATEELLRQLFLENLDTGSKAESQRIRYLSFYPSYFFSPETLMMVRRAYNAIKSIRLSDKDLRQALHQQDDLTSPQFWQRLDTLLLSPHREEGKFSRVLNYSPTVQPTFFTIGFRNIDPSDIESWVLPTFLAFVLSLNLDVKVVASDSSLPLMLEASELPETIWFDGVHGAILNLLGESRLHIDKLGKTLAKLTAAYLIHLDTEYEPPKENWQRFVPLVNSLCESPLYVFHYLKKQERDERPITIEKVRRYMRYVDLFSDEKDQDMSHARKLVELYRGFYRAKTMKSTNSILRPIMVISDALLVADPQLFSDAESLIEVAHGELYRFMDRVRKGLADGGLPKGITPTERQEKMHEFCTKFVNDIFIGTFNKDVAALRGKQLNLLKSACEIIYRDEQAKEWATTGSDADDDTEETSDN